MNKPNIYNRLQMSKQGEKSIIFQTKCLYECKTQLCKRYNLSCIAMPVTTVILHY